jgi:hypothetical protein
MKGEKAFTVMVLVPTDKDFSADQNVLIQFNINSVHFPQNLFA